jgi:hypothetical protein
MDKKDVTVERRAFQRYSIGLTVKVSAYDRDGAKFTEFGILENVSGGGAKFFTENGDNYFHGQSLDITVSLPGTDEINAAMQGQATVVRIDAPRAAGHKGDHTHVVVAVKFHDRLRFVRDDTLSDIHERN